MPSLDDVTDSSSYRVTVYQTRHTKAVFKLWVLVGRGTEVQVILDGLSAATVSHNPYPKTAEMLAVLAACIEIL